MQWDYHIKLFANYPLHYKEIMWPIMNGNQYITYAVRSILYNSNRNLDTHLTIKVEKLANKQGPLHWPVAYKLKILRDDLNIYEYNKDVYWAPKKIGGAFQIFELILQDPRSTTSPFMDNSNYITNNIGIIINVIFFADYPNTYISLGGKNSPVKLVFRGLEKIKSLNLKVAHFTYLVQKSKNEHGFKATKSYYLNKGYTEDRWYAEKIGLIYLVQRVDNQKTMTWTLDGYTFK